MIDAMARLATVDDVELLLDSDCIFNQPMPADLAERVKHDRVLLYSINYSLDQSVNGWTRRQLLAMTEEYGGRQLREFVY